MHACYIFFTIIDGEKTHKSFLQENYAHIFLRIIESKISLS